MTPSSWQELTRDRILATLERDLLDAPEEEVLGRSPIFRPNQSGFGPPPSFPRKRESSENARRLTWVPAFAGTTSFFRPYLAGIGPAASIESSAISYQ